MKCQALEHERNYGLGMDALIIVCPWNTNAIMVWACMLWSSYALGTRMELWFGHGCSGHRVLLEHKQNYGLGMDALVIVCSAGGSTWRQRVPLRTDPGASPAAKESCWNHRTQGPRGCVPPKKTCMASVQLSTVIHKV